MGYRERQKIEEDGGGGSSGLVVGVACRKKWKLKEKEKALS